MATASPSIQDITSGKPRMTFRSGLEMVSFSKFFIYIALIMASLFFLFPTVWMTGTSFKTIEEVQQPQLNLFPADPQWENYEDILSEDNFYRAYSGRLVQPITRAGVRA